jgi:hypothetical protein
MRRGIAFAVIIGLALLCLAGPSFAEDAQEVAVEEITEVTDVTETPNAPVSGPVIADKEEEAVPEAPSNTTKEPETIAHIIDQALIKEFDKEEKQHESEVGKDFNKTVAMDEVSSCSAPLL